MGRKGKNKSGGVKDNVKALFEAIRESDLERVQKLIAEKVNVNVKNVHGATPLYLTCFKSNEKEGAEEIVKALIEAGAAVDETFGENKITPLMATSKEGKLKVLEALIAGGANVHSKDRMGLTALFYAASAGGHDDAEIAETLIEAGAIVNEKSNLNNTPLFLAAQENKPNILGMLIERGAVVDHQDRDGSSALSASSYMGHADIVKILITNKVEVNSKDIYGKTPLHAAATKGHESVIKILLGAGADIDAISTIFGKKITPAKLACMRLHEGAVNLLLERKAEKEKCTPLEAAFSVDVDRDIEVTVVALKFVLKKSVTKFAQELSRSAIKTTKTSDLDKIFGKITELMERIEELAKKHKQNTTILVEKSKTAVKDTLQEKIDGGIFEVLEKKQKDRAVDPEETAIANYLRIKLKEIGVNVDALIVKPRAAAAKLENATVEVPSSPQEIELGNDANPLAFAIQEGDVDVVKELLMSGLDTKKLKIYNAQGEPIEVTLLAFSYQLLLNDPSNANFPTIKNLLTGQISTEFSRNYLEFTTELLSTTTIEDKSKDTWTYLYALNKYLQDTVRDIEKLPAALNDKSALTEEARKAAKELKGLRKGIITNFKVDVFLKSLAKKPDSPGNKSVFQYCLKTIGQFDKDISERLKDVRESTQGQESTARNQALTELAETIYEEMRGEISESKDKAVEEVLNEYGMAQASSAPAPTTDPARASTPSEPEPTLVETEQSAPAPTPDPVPEPTPVETEQSAPSLDSAPAPVETEESAPEPGPDTDPGPAPAAPEHQEDIEYDDTPGLEKPTSFEAPDYNALQILLVQAKEEISELETQIKSGANPKLEKELQKIADEKRKLENEVKALKAKNEKLTTNLKHRSSEVEEAEVAEEKLRKELENLKKGRTTLEVKLKANKGVLTTQSTKITELQEEIRELNEQINPRQSTKPPVQKTDQEKDTAIRDLKRQVAVMAAENETLRAEIETKDSKLRSAETQKKEETKKVEAVKAAKEENMRGFAAIQGNLNTQIDTLTSREAEFQKRLEAASAEIQALRSRPEYPQTQAGSAEYVQRLMHTNQGMSAQLMQSRQLATNLRGEIEQLKAEKSDFAIALETAKNRLAQDYTFKQEYDASFQQALLKRDADTRAAIKERDEKAGAAIAEKNALIIRLQEENRALQAQIDTLTAQLEEVNKEQPTAVAAHLAEPKAGSVDATWKKVAEEAIKQKNQDSEAAAELVAKLRGKRDTERAEKEKAQLELNAAKTEAEQAQDALAAMQAELEAMQHGINEQAEMEEAKKALANVTTTSNKFDDSDEEEQEGQEETLYLKEEIEKLQQELREANERWQHNEKCNRYFKSYVPAIFTDNETTLPPLPFPSLLVRHESGRYYSLESQLEGNIDNYKTEHLPYLEVPEDWQNQKNIACYRSNNDKKYYYLPSGFDFTCQLYVYNEETKLHNTVAEYCAAIDQEAQKHSHGADKDKGVGVPQEEITHLENLLTNAAAETPSSTPRKAKGERSSSQFAPEFTKNAHH